MMLTTMGQLDDRRERRKNSLALRSFTVLIPLCYFLLSITLARNSVVVQATRDVYIPDHHYYQLKDVMPMHMAAAEADEEKSDNSSDDDPSLPSDPNDAFETDEPTDDGKEKLQSNEQSEDNLQNAEKQENEKGSKHEEPDVEKKKKHGADKQKAEEQTETEEKEEDNENDDSSKDTSVLTGKFIHVTDFHFDPRYLEGATVKSFCHRLKKSQHHQHQRRALHDHHKDKKKPKQGKVAGKFGALGSDCDSPEALIKATFEFIQQHKVDFIVYTGDSAPHDRDEKEVLPYEIVIDAQEYIANAFRKSSPTTKVLPVIGNIDVEKHNIVSPQDVETFHDVWKGYITEASPVKKGYFVEELHGGKLRSIHLDTMDFLSSNEEIPDCDMPRSPGRLQLDWLRQSLKETRAQKAKAYMLVHIPPNDKDDTPFYKPKCYQEYYSILGSYSDIILGHFSGHFNRDQLTAVLQNKKDGTFSRVAALGKKGMKDELMSPAELEQYQVVGALLNGPSIIPKQNPAIRIYTYQITENARVPVGTILDWDQYYADLNEANAEGLLEYKLEYTASNTYGVGRFDKYGLQQLFTHLSLNETVRQDYVAFRKVRP